MVLYYTSTAVEPPVTFYMGKDKFENEELLKYGLEQDIWFHVDKLSSAHVYLRLSAELPDWENIPEKLLQDCSQLVKANSIEGNKKSNVTIIYTPWSNVKKTGDMAIGAVTFHNDRKVKRFHIKERDNAIVNRLNKTKREVDVDHEAERQDRLREEGRKKKAKAVEDRKNQLAEQKRRKEESEARDYSKLYTDEAMEAERQQREERKQAKLRSEITKNSDEDEAMGDDGMDSDDSFM